MSDKEAIRQAVRFIKVGKKSEAREVLKSVIARDKDDPFAWAAMVQAVESRQEAIFCLKQVLRLKPGDVWAASYLRRLEGTPAQPLPGPQPVSSSLPASEAAQPLRVATAAPERRLHPLPSQGAAAQVGEQRPASVDQAGLLSAPARATPEEEAADLVAPKRASPVRSLLNYLPWIAVVLCLFTSLVAVWYEFLASHPGDEEKAIQAAREWTEASLRSDYEMMTDLVCSRYKPDIRSAESMASFLGGFGMTFGGEPPAELLRSITYELVSIKGNTARVRVGGYSSHYIEFLGDSFVGGGDYVMKRELGKWKWCGREE
jgi:hypothetical protein